MRHTHTHTIKCHDKQHIGKGISEKHGNAKTRGTHDQRHADEDCAGQIAVRVFQLFGDKVEIVPAVIGPQAGDDCHAKAPGVARCV
jgi:hypothetical protein